MSVTARDREPNPQAEKWRLSGHEEPAKGSGTPVAGAVRARQVAFSSKLYL